MISGDEQNPLKYFKNLEKIWNSIFNYFPTKIANLDPYYNRCDITIKAFEKDRFRYISRHDCLLINKGENYEAYVNKTIAKPFAD